jgi:hypothetical protein
MAKSEGKITIGVQSKGRNAIAPEIHPSYPEIRMEWFFLWEGNLGYSPSLVPFLGDFLNLFLNKF